MQPVVACSSSLVLLVVTDSETKTAKYENNIETSISSFYSQTNQLLLQQLAL